MEEQQITPASGFKFTKKTVLGLVVLLLLITAIPIGVYLSQQKQLFRPKAAGITPVSGPEASLSFWAPTGGALGTEIRVGIVVRSDFDSANLVVSKLKFPTDLLEVSSIDVTTGPTFVKNWIEKNFDNKAGTVSLSGGLPDPGFKTTVGQHAEWMAQVIFKTKKVGLATVSFDTDSAIYRNSDNVNVLSIKRDTTFEIESPVPSITPAPTIGAVSNRVFITSLRYNGNLGGLTGADAKCQVRADAANLGGSWKAWLSDNTISVNSRLNHSNSPYKLLNGTTVANNWADLIDGTIQNPIMINELNQSAAGTSWTNTNQYGQITSTDLATSCNNWTSADSTNNIFNVLGNYFLTDSAWTMWQTGTYCNVPQTLYCFEQGSVAPTPTPVGIKGDVNGDGKITLVDMSALLSRWGKSGAEAGKADINVDGVVNTFDYSLLIQILIQNGVIKGSTDIPTNLQRGVPLPPEKVQ